MEQTKHQAQRVIPNGKVYRQMFDAETQLVRALERHSGKSKDLSRQVAETVADLRDLKTAPATSLGEKSATVPLVRDTETLTSAGLLNPRQAIWSQGFSNEQHIENPVLYKFYKDEMQAETAETEASIASREVRGLPDVLSSGKSGSDIIERIAESRRQRHEQTLEEMFQDLGIISSELEPEIETAGITLMNKLNENDTEIRAIMARIDNDEDLKVYSLQGLEDLWKEAASFSSVRQSWIVDLDGQLNRVEETRMRRIREVLQNYAEQLEKIAHLMLPDLHKLLDKESQLINQAILSNRRAYADLYARLMMSDIEREKRLHIQWKKRLDDWKKLHTDLAIRKFKEYMDSDTVTKPEGVAAVLEEMRVQQQALNKRRLDLINSLREFKPPASTKTLVYKWNQQITEISRDIDQLNQDFFNRLYAEYEKVCQECLRQVDLVQTDLLARGVCAQERAKQVIEDQCLPLVGERQAAFEKSLEEMDKALEAHNAHILSSLKSLFKYSQGAAHVWDVHELGLAKQERALQEKLDEIRQLHDTENQDKEANLDIIMDRMRQDATEEALKESLTQALSMLELIKDGYEVFHKKQKSMVEGYPDMVEKELKNLDATVCRFFTVDRNNPQKPDKQKDKDKDNKGKDKEEEDDDKSKKSVSKKKKNKKGGMTSRSSSRTSLDGNEDSSVSLAVSEVLSTAKGTTFYVLTVAGEHGVQQDADDDQQEEPPKTAYLENVDVPDRLLREIKQEIRMNFLNHLDEWMDQARDRAKNVVAAKTEEMNSELDLRMHLHQPRSRRAELDVHNVRAAELVMHSERVQRHCKGVSQALADLKQRFNDMTAEHNDLADKFREDIEALEIVFINATKSSKLVSLSNQLSVEQDKYMTVIRTSLRQFRQHLDDTLQMLRESNAQFIKSFKLFSDGGNFCPEEIEDYLKRLEKMSQKIDSSEGFVMADLEGMESKRLEQASKVSAEFEDRFKHHMIDLVFMEKIARWLTNTQVKIKAEVADSNTQAQNLAQSLAKLEKSIDACLRPNLDKEDVSPAQLNNMVRMMFDAFQSRSVYLNCLKDQSGPRPGSAKPLQGNPALAMLSDDAAVSKTVSFIAESEVDSEIVEGGRVGFAYDSLPSVSRPGKQPVEDPSVGVIKNILITQKSRIKSDEGEGDDNTKSGETTAAVAEGDKKAKLRSTMEQDKFRKSSRQGLDKNSTVDGKHPQSGQATRYSSTETLQSSMRASSVVTLLLAKKKRSCLSSKGQKLDKKYFVFGENEEVGDESHLLGRVRKVLRDTLDGLLSAAELYYNKKGNRPVTRPQALQETFDSCADVVVQKLQSYCTQTDKYHNQCLQEFREQLVRLEELVSQVPQCVIAELLQNTKTEVKKGQQMLKKEFMLKLRTWEKEKKNNETHLRPSLGHPQQAGELRALCSREEARHNQVLQAIDEQSTALKDALVMGAQTFVENLAAVSEQLLLQFDSLLTVDDVEKGRVPPTKYPTSELIRRKNDGAPLHDIEVKETMPRGKATWQGLPKTEMILAKSEGRPNSGKQPSVNVTASVTTAKTTLGHHATEKARDAVYQEFKLHFENILRDIDEEIMSVKTSEQHWTESWNISVEKVKQLY